MLPVLGNSLGGLPLQLDANAKDFETIRARAFELIQQITPEWTDFYPNDPGVAMVEAVASIAAVLHYSLDRVQNEAYLLTAQQRSSVIDLLRLIGYRMRPAGAASVPLTITTTGPVLLPRLYAVSSTPSADQPQIRFELLSEVAIPGAGTWTTLEIPELVVVEGTTVVQDAGASLGQPRQRVLLTRTPVVGNSDGSSSIRVRVGPAMWTEVASFSGQGPSAEVFTWREDNSGAVIVQFGDGVNGAIPTLGLPVEIEYRIGGGERANSIGVGEITTALQNVAGVSALFNPVAPSGGAERESIEEAKVQGPLSLRALDRAVTLEDFETLARQVPGVRSARAVHGRGPYEVIVYVSAEGVNPMPSGVWFPRLLAGTGLLGVVGRYLLARKALPHLDVRGAIPVRPRLRANIKVFPNISRRDAAAEVDRKLRAYYAEAQNRLGRLLPLSDIVGVIENSRGVDYVDMLEYHRLPIVALERGSSAALDNATVTVPTVYPTSISERFTIRWLNDTMFRILDGSRSTLRDAMGRRMRFSANERVTVSLFSGGDDPRVRKQTDLFDLQIDLGVGFAPRRGDMWILSVDNYLGNLVLEPFEVIAPALLGSPARLDPTFHEITYGGGLG